MKHIDIVFDGPPEREGPRFIEVEDDAGRSISVGEWLQRPDGYWVLRLVAQRKDEKDPEGSTWNASNTEM